MSAYTGGRGRAPNVSQYLAGLNSTSPTTSNMAGPDEFTLADDLDFLTNAEFFDFDTFQPAAGEFAQQQHASKVAGVPGVPGVNPAYQFGEFQTYPTGTMKGSLPTSPSSGLPGTFHVGAPSYPETGDKRSASSAGLSSAPDFEEGARMAAEEDKRRRNTAASARFRVKKKQREQALEKQSKELSDKVLALEGKVKSLEQENKWLKNLITEKSDDKTTDSIKAQPTSSPAESEASQTKDSKHTTGVGTKIEA